MRGVIFGLLVCCGVADAAANPWVAMTAGDVQAMHDALEANHPGPARLTIPEFAPTEAGCTITVRRRIAPPHDS